jgi:hypothetical protein
MACRSPSNKTADPLAGRNAELSNHANNLAAVQGRVIDDMLHLLNER